MWVCPCHVTDEVCPCGWWVCVSDNLCRVEGPSGKGLTKQILNDLVKGHYLGKGSLFR